MSSSPANGLTKSSNGNDPIVTSERSSSTISKSCSTAIRLLLTAALLYFTVTNIYTLLGAAYDIRLHAIRTFGYIIHEFDPYFNFRATQYLYDNGWKKFATWFDYKVWYPLGRPVGTTIYPGMQVTAVWLTKTWLPAWFGMREWAFGRRAIPHNVVAKSASQVAANANSIVTYLLASTSSKLGMKWQEMSLNDVCCLMPAWFGAWATLITGLLACECSANFIGYGEGAKFGTALDYFPLLGYYIRMVTTPIRRALTYYSGLDASSPNQSSARGRSCLQTTSLLSMLATMFFMSVVPAHLMRSVGGGYDNESVAVTAMTLVFYLWTRSLRGCRITTFDQKNSNVDSHILQKQDVGFKMSYSTKIAFFWGALTGIAYFNMVAAWGGYVFVINLVGVHTAALILLGRHSSKLHAAYSAFFLLGTALATRVPVVGTTPLRSLEQLGPMMVFFGIQLVEYCERVRTRDNLSRSKVWLLRLRLFGAAALVAIAIVTALWPTGYFGPISSRVRGLFVKHTKTGNPLVDSVAEHQAAKPEAYEHYLLILKKLAPIGFGMVAIGFTNDASSFLLVYGLAAYFFSHKMVRLILLTAPIASVLGGLLLGRIAGTCVEGICGWKLDAYEIISVLFSVGKEECVIVKECSTREDISSKKGKKKANDEKLQGPNDAVSKKISIRSNSFFRLFSRLLWLYLANYLFNRAKPEMKKFKSKCQEMSANLSHPSILFKGQRADGSTFIVDDYREAYWWLRDNTPEDSRIMAWWDYGYQITGIANRTTIADGNTWNHEHIALLGRALTGPFKEGHRIARHLADYVLLWTGGGGDDLAKSPHLVRIANSVYRHICPGDPTCSRFGMMSGGRPGPMMRESLLYHLHSNGLQPGVEVDKNRFKEVYKSKHGKVRIYKIMSVSQESKEWVLKNRVCDAPGSWFCRGQYPPGLEKVLAEKRDFKQLEDFNSKADADDEYQRKYFEHLSDPEKAKRRAEVRERKQRGGGQDEGNRIPLTKEQIKEMNQQWEDNEATSRLFEIIRRNDFESLEYLLDTNPEYAHARSKDGRGPMWWSHEHGRKKMIALLKSRGVSEKLRDKHGMTPLDLAEDEL